MVSRRMSLVRSMIGSLISEKSFGPFATPNGKRRRMYAILLIIVIAITAMRANTCSRLYAASMSNFVMKIQVDGWWIRIIWMACKMRMRQCP